MALAVGFSASLLAFGLITPLAWRVFVCVVLMVLPLAVVQWRKRASAIEPYPPPPPGGWMAYPLATPVVYAVAATIGTVADMHGQPWFWVPASIVVAMPLVVLALWQWRHDR